MENCSKDERHRLTIIVQFVWRPVLLSELVISGVSSACCDARTSAFMLAQVRSSSYTEADSKRKDVEWV